MSKGKLEKFADMATYANVFQCPYSAVKEVLDAVPAVGDGNVPSIFSMQGYWRERYFHNDNPIVLELGCGKGEYTVGLAKSYPQVNFIGVDIKGARMWSGATQALDEGLANVAFLRTNIEIIDRFFAQNEVQEIWLTFSDPQMKNPRKRLTSTYFMERYRRFLVDGGTVHLKTDSNFLYTYTNYMVEHNQLPLLYKTEDLYGDVELGRPLDAQIPQNLLTIQTYYESMWIARGLNIKYMKWQLPHASLLSEPDVEIELDGYRSYHRTKRSSLDRAK